MPIHEYACRDCGNHFEKLVRSSDALGSLRCPRCNSVQLDKQLSVFATASTGAADPGLAACATGPADNWGGCGTCGNPAGPGACSLPN